MFELEINSEEQNGSWETAQEENHIKQLHHYLKAKFKQ